MTHRNQNSVTDSLGLALSLHLPPCCASHLLLVSFKQRRENNWKCLGTNPEPVSHSVCGSVGEPSCSVSRVNGFYVVLSLPIAHRFFFWFN